MITQIWKCKILTERNVYTLHSNYWFGRYYYLCWFFKTKFFCSKDLFYSRLRQLNQCFQSWLPKLVTLPSDSTIILSMVCKVLLLFVSKAHKTFRERQHPRPAEIGKCAHWLSVAISTSDPPHCTLHHATDFQAMMWFPRVSLYESSSVRPGPCLS